MIVAGGGPVGLAAAIYARTAGLTVTMFEPRTAPVDKACGEGVMPAAVTELARLGVRPAGVPFRGIRYLDGSAFAQSLFPGRPGLGVRRTELSTALLRRALDLGVEVVTFERRKPGRIEPERGVEILHLLTGLGDHGHEQLRLVLGHQQQ